MSSFRYHPLFRVIKRVQRRLYVTVIKQDLTEKFVQMSRLSKNLLSHRERPRFPSKKKGTTGPIVSITERPRFTLVQTIVGNIYVPKGVGTK